MSRIPHGVVLIWFAFLVNMILTFRTFDMELEGEQLDVEIPRDSDFRKTPIVPGWAILCRHTCTQDLIDAMDASKTKLALIDARAKKNGYWAVRTTFGWSSPYAVGSVEEKLQGPGLRVILHKYSSDRLTILPGDRVDFRTVLSVVSHKAREKISLVESEESFPQMNAYFLYNQDENQNRKRAGLWKQQAEWDELSIQRFRKARALEKERHQELVRQRISNIMRSKFTEILSIFETVRHEISTKASSMTCRGRPVSLAAVRAELESAREEHRAESAENLNAIADLSVSIAFSGLLAAADAGAPGLGAVLQATGMAVQYYEEVGGKMNDMFKSTELGVAMQGVASKLEEVMAQVSKIEEGIEAKFSGDITTAVDEADKHLPSSVRNVTDTFSETVVDEFQSVVTDGLEESIKKDTLRLRTLVSKVQGAAQEAVRVGITESAWTAAGMIPLLGPFVVMSRNMVELADVGRTQLQSQRAYFAMKDPILRSLFHMRDCSLSVLLGSDALVMSGSESVSYDARAAALMAAMNTAEDSLGINEDLSERVHQQVWWFQTADKHESRVMDRLRSGSSKVGRIPLGPGDSYLPRDVLSPTEWQIQVGDVISAARAQMQRLASEYDEQAGAVKPKLKQHKRHKEPKGGLGDGLEDNEPGLGDDEDD